MKFIELFAGVGGFRIGLSKADKVFDCVWANQWEPATKVQHAANVYRYHFGDKDLSNTDINDVIKENHPIPNHDLLTAGFPCQDFSVAHTVAWSKGLEGKKGNLWYSILDVIDKKNPRYCLFENVNRLLLSPALERGRDFAYILASLNDRGYAVEWLVVDASKYGFPQKRKRVFFLCSKKGTKTYQDLKKGKEGVLKNTFPFTSKEQTIHLSSHIGDGSLDTVFKKFNPPPKGKKIYGSFTYKSPKKFFDYGTCIDREYVTYNIIPYYRGKYTLLGDIIVKEDNSIPKEYFVNKTDLKKWKEAKFGGVFSRKSKEGFEYKISIGKMSLDDSLNEPSRTILTGEGGKAASRTKHLIKTHSGQYRRLLPTELEKLNMFPDSFTEFGKEKDGTEYNLLDSRRAFLMGNALVTGCVKQIGKVLLNRLSHN